MESFTDVELNSDETQMREVCIVALASRTVLNMTSDSGNERSKQDENNEVFEKDIEGNISDHSSLGSPAPLNTNDDPGKKNKSKPRTRKRLIKDVNAPKAPLTGYVRFLNEHREKFREQHPVMPFHEVTKILGQKWSSMAQEEKQQYLEEAEREKEKYMRALEGYQQSSAYKEFQEMKKRKEAEQHDVDNELKQTKSNIKVEYPHSNSPSRNGIPALQGPKITTDTGMHIPVFTEQFLEYSRQRESELRQVRKNNSVYEEQNAILNKQIDHMKNVMDRVKTDIIQQENENLTMQTYLDKFRKLLVDLFKTFPFPSHLSERLTCENIDTKLTQLTEYLSTGRDVSQDLRKKLKDLISRIDYPTLKE
ncbi:high mobility group protein 20A-like isoform X2 [Hydractinia symbiolongicarpus]|uniref:high mobility group protein 20A-like isoform X2 n=1 Tax=Hydractinia symbiolongicarpus TaxID=13093 RepID=UPI00254F85BD|nr:high mobility group protein 20A-like isoform X2 [Hydractinia symbiolongicarpus]